jgi:formylglycine-generating enzyme required for sulfatase activity
MMVMPVTKRASAASLLVALAALAFVFGACADLGGLSGDGGSADAAPADGSSTEDGGVFDASADGTGPDAGAARCKGSKGPVPVKLDGYCIDATEVSNLQFAEFMAATGGDAGAQPAACAGVTIPPDTGFWPRNDKLPVRSVSWCGARAYCAWAGKRLCGRIGGGVLAPTEHKNPFANEWYAACSSKGTRAYPYGATYDPEACRGAQHSSTATGNVGSLTTCEGPPGVFDMVGNVWEWIDHCVDVAVDGGTWRRCVVRGGSYANDDPAEVACGSELSHALDPLGTDMGIRCCSDLE